MLAITWNETYRIRHDPNAIEVYRFDWTHWLEGETLASVDIDVVGVSGSVVSWTSTYVDFEISGGTVGLEASVTITATSSLGRVQPRTTPIYVVSR